MKRVFRYMLLMIFAASFLCVSATGIVNSEPVMDKQVSQGLETKVSGEIDSEIFSRSVPGRMIIGETYVIVLVIKNTGNMNADFLVYLYFPFQTLLKYFYTLRVLQNLTLYPGESQRVEFYLTPVSTHTGPLAIVANLYSLSADETILVDSLSATVSEISTALSVEKTMWIVGVVVFSVFIGFAIRFLKKPAIRRDYIIAFMLFFGALLLRAPNLLRIAIYPDEMTFRWLGWYILKENGVWSKGLMWGGYPPLYYYLSAASTYLFGSSDLEALRAISAVSGSLTVIPTYFLGKSLYGKKVGLLSALLLCFFSFHILYSRIAMTEVLMLFLMTTSTYFFWKGYSNKSWKNMCVSGIFLGLSLNTKYIAVVSVVAAVLFVVWIEKSWKPLLKRDFLVWLATIFVVVSPVQLLLLINRVNPYGWYLSRVFSPKPLGPTWRFFPILELIPRGLRLQVFMGARAASPWLPWLPAYELAIIVSFLATILYYVPHSLKARAKESFLMLFFLLPLSLQVIPSRQASWLLYPISYYFIMLSSFAVGLVCSLRSDNMRTSCAAKGLRRYPHSLKIFVLLFIAIFVFSNVLVGALAPAVDAGDPEGARLAILYIKNRVNQGDVISGVGGLGFSHYGYYISLYDINVTYIPLVKVSERARLVEKPISEGLRLKPEAISIAPIRGEFVLDEYVLTTLKPRFIVITRAYLDFFFNATMKEVLLSNYQLVWFGRPSVGYFSWVDEMNSKTRLVFERKTQ